MDLSCALPDVVRSTLWTVRRHSAADISLSAEERRAFDRLFDNADTEQLGVLTGDKAVPFFEASELPGQVRPSQLIMCQKWRDTVDTRTSADLTESNALLDHRCWAKSGRLQTTRTLVSSPRRLSMSCAG